MGKRTNYKQEKRRKELEKQKRKVDKKERKNTNGQDNHDSETISGDGAKI